MRSFIRALPKAELHMHLEGALEPELALAFAQRNRIELRFGFVEQLRESYQFTDLQSFLNLFYECTASLVTEQDFYELTLSYLARAATDGVRHTEVFFEPYQSRGEIRNRNHRNSPRSGRGKAAVRDQLEPNHVFSAAPER